jgi:hypothetical protein
MVKKVDLNKCKETIDRIIFDNNIENEYLKTHLDNIVSFLEKDEVNKIHGCSRVFTDENNEIRVIVHKIYRSSPFEILAKKFTSVRPAFYCKFSSKIDNDSHIVHITNHLPAHLYIGIKSYQIPCRIIFRILDDQERTIAFLTKKPRENMKAFYNKFFHNFINVILYKDDIIQMLITIEGCLKNLIEDNSGH